MDIKNLSSNWKKLQASGSLAKLDSQKHTQPTVKPIRNLQQNGTVKRKRSNLPQNNRTKHPSKRSKHTATQIMAEGPHNATKKDGTITIDGASERELTDNDRINEGLAKKADIGKYVALDCEMVGVGPHPHLESALARVSIVNYNGEQVYDSYVKPLEEVTDWRTHVSGIQPKHMIYARSFEAVQADISSIIKERVVVGHSVRGDFEALLLDHPKRDLRDTARHLPYRKLAGGGSPKLKILASGLLGLEIQSGEHSSIEDARATMLLFKRDKEAFEREHMKKWGSNIIAKKAETEASEANAKKPKKKKKKKR